MYWIIAVVLALAFFIFLYVVTDHTPTFEVQGKHVVITGGSSGIGFSVAKTLLSQGAHVTIIARNKTKLDSATEELKVDAPSSAKVMAQSADVSDAQSIKLAIQQAAADMNGQVDVLLTCAGFSIPGRFDEVDDDAFSRQMNVNYLGTVYSIRAALPFLKQQEASRIMMTSSMLGQTGVAGFSCYAPAKFALRGLAECLAMELAYLNCKVSVINPPDVDTPGYHEELKIKPLEAKLISEGAGLFTSEEIAADIVGAMRNYKFAVNSGLDGKLLAIASVGTAPAGGIIQTLVELLTLGIVRVVSLGYTWNFNRIVSQARRQIEAERAEKEGEEKSE